MPIPAPSPEQIARNHVIIGLLKNLVETEPRIEKSGNRYTIKSAESGNVICSIVDSREAFLPINQGITVMWSFGAPYFMWGSFTDLMDDIKDRAVEVEGASEGNTLEGWLESQINERLAMTGKANIR
jgi:hypothetical protein